MRRCGVVVLWCCGGIVLVLWCFPLVPVLLCGKGWGEGDGKDCGERCGSALCGVILLCRQLGDDRLIMSRPVDAYGPLYVRFRCVCVCARVCVYVCVCVRVCVCGDKAQTQALKRGLEWRWGGRHGNDQTWHFLLLFFSAAVYSWRAAPSG